MSRSSIKKLFLKILQFSQKKHLRWSLFLNKNVGLQSRNFIKMKLQHWACNFIKKDNLAQALSCQFCEISKNTFSYRQPLVDASNYHLYCNSKYYHSSSETYLEPCQISMIELF